MNNAKEYARDTAHDPPEWVQIAHGCTVLNFIRHNGGVRISSRFSLKEGRKPSTYLLQKEYEDCRCMAQSILHPHRRRRLPPPHWMDRREDD